jgi:hypothetical protein
VVEATDSELLQDLRDRAMTLGATQHHFYGSDNEVFVVDEWPDEATFQKFFESTPEIKDMMDRAGAGHPEISFWHHLDVNDDIG